MNDGNGEPEDQNDHRKQEEEGADDVDHGQAARSETAGQDVDAHMLVFLQRVRRTEQENGREQIPLDFQQAIRAVVENEADNGIAGADEGHQQNQPECTFADALVDQVDQLRELE